MFLTRKLTHSAALAAVSLWISGCNPVKTVSAPTCPTIPYATQPITSATFTMGATRTYPEEAERVGRVGNYDIDAHEVTNAQFAAFIDATGYITTAEKPQVGFDVEGAAVFMPPNADNPNWWRFVPGATWHQPEGPGSSIKGQGTYPVVQVSYEDALAYAAWSKRDLPTEAEWEYAAGAGAVSQYVWGDERTPSGKEMANTWQGTFPLENTQNDGFDLRAPVGCFPANTHGLYDMIGTVWEWTKSDTPSSSAAPTYVIKGGSYLCAENYCARYRSAARQFQEADLPTNNIGFRTVSRQDPDDARK
jgi:formylglycine-generating enzyme required for sulfatase activity